jgi:heme exporter protein A
LPKRLEAQDLKCIRGDRELFSDIHFSLDDGELLHVAGPNGSGKTTLLRMLCGLVEPAHGAVHWQGKPIAHWGEDYFAQLTHLGHANAVKGDLTCHENLQFPARLAGVTVTDAELDAALDHLDLSGCGDLPSRVLSQGQKRRLGLARLLVAETRLWILDEPFNALDTAAVAKIRATVEQHVNGGGIVVLTSHQDIGLEVEAQRRLELGS